MKKFLREINEKKGLEAYTKEQRSQETFEIEKRQFDEVKIIKEAIRKIDK